MDHPHFAEAHLPLGDPVSKPQPIDDEFLIEEQTMPDYANLITDSASPPMQRNLLPKKQTVTVHIDSSSPMKIGL